MKDLEKNFYDFVFCHHPRTKIVNVDKYGSATFRKCAIGQFVKKEFNLHYDGTSQDKSNFLDKCSDVTSEINFKVGITLVSLSCCPSSYGGIQKLILRHTTYKPETIK